METFYDSPKQYARRASVAVDGFDNLYVSRRESPGDIWPPLVYVDVVEGEAASTILQVLRAMQGTIDELANENRTLLDAALGDTIAIDVAHGRQL